MANQHSNQQHAHQQPSKAVAHSSHFGESEMGGASLMPPTMQFKLGGGATPPDSIAAAIKFNNHGQHKNEIGRFRLDWVRNMQKALGIKNLSTDRSFNQETIEAIMKFQTEKGLPADGKITPSTRRVLDASFPQLQYELFGEHAEEKHSGRTILKAGEEGQAVGIGNRSYKNDKSRYDFYKKVIVGTGGYFEKKEGHINMLAIRGAVLTKTGEIKQTHTAALAKKDFDAGKESTNIAHFGDDKTTRTNRTKLHKDKKLDVGHSWDDMIISLWKEGENYVVKERKGSVDPASVNKEMGTAHLVDGQHTFQMGRRHTTSSTAHKAVAKRLNKKDSKTINGTGWDDKYAYEALRSHGNQEIYRESMKKKLKNFHIDKNEFETSVAGGLQEQIKQYVNRKNLGVNIHAGQKDSSLSLGCQNIPEDQYLDFIKEIGQAKAKHGQSRFLYTLVDASKIPPKTERSFWEEINHQAATYYTDLENQFKQNFAPAKAEEEKAVSSEKTNTGLADFFNGMAKTMESIPYEVATVTHLAQTLIQEEKNPDKIADEVYFLLNPSRNRKKIEGGEVAAIEEWQKIKQTVEQLMSNKQEVSNQEEWGTEEGNNEHISQDEKTASEEKSMASSQNLEERKNQRADKLSKKLYQKKKFNVISTGELFLGDGSYSIKNNKISRAQSTVGEITITRDESTKTLSINYNYTDKEGNNHTGDLLKGNFSSKGYTRNGITAQAGEGSKLKIGSDEWIGYSLGGWIDGIKVRGGGKGYAIYGGGNAEDSLEEFLGQKIAVGNKKQTNEALKEFTKEELDFYTSIAQVESSGQIQGINTWDSHTMSMGFKQLTMAGKLQRWIKRNPDAFKKYGIELTKDKKSNVVRGKKVQSVVGAEDGKDLRGLFWAMRFYEAGLDKDIIKEEIAEARYHVGRAQNKISRYTAKSGGHHLKHEGVTAILLELFNNREAFLKPSLELTMKEVNKNTPVKTFVNVLHKNMRTVYGELEPLVSWNNNRAKNNKSIPRVSLSLNWRNNIKKRGKYSEDIEKKILKYHSEFSGRTTSKADNIANIRKKYSDIK